MDFNLKTVSELSSLASDCLVVPISEDSTFNSITAALLEQSTDSLIQSILKSGDFKGEKGSTLMLHHPVGCKAQRLLLVGIGKPEKTDKKNKPELDRITLSVKDFRTVMTGMLTAIRKTSAGHISIYLDNVAVDGQSSAWQYQQIALLAIGQSYHYTETKSQKDDKPGISKISLLQTQNKASKDEKKALDIGKAIGLGVNTARHLGNLPANICTPTYLANKAQSMASEHNVLSVKVLEEKQMQKLGMGAFLSVTAGTEQPAKLIVMEYKGAAKNRKPYVLVGKGITFDSGGISLKPGAKMDEMKFDMCGAASVIGVMTSIATLQPKLNVTAIIACAENLPSGNATKPGDIVTSMAGKTIEILNTDAEGRLILCDALTYAERFKPEVVIDIATLTGACVVALGSHASGLYSNQDELARQLLDAGDSIHDRAWHMPLWDDYKKQLDSNFADLANVGGPEGGSITAACFLSEFATKYDWAHLDIAGTAWLGGAQKGATGRPVPLLVQYLLNQQGG